MKKFLINLMVFILMLLIPACFSHISLADMIPPPPYKQGLIEKEVKSINKQLEEISTALDTASDLKYEDKEEYDKKLSENLFQCHQLLYSISEKHINTDEEMTEELESEQRSVLAVIDKIEKLRKKLEKYDEKGKTSQQSNEQQIDDQHISDHVLGDQQIDEEIAFFNFAYIPLGLLVLLIVSTGFIALKSIKTRYTK